VARKSAILDEHCAAVGRDPREIERSVGVGGSDPDELGDQMLDRGVTLFTIDVSGPDHDLGRLAAWLRWRDEVNG
ncbi:MAG: class F420-dependent oxidoreductase, partial [Actinotalea sp.]|nr:class F420-dependent oxidoreductase [Actinotalea sp.]